MSNVIPFEFETNSVRVVKGDAGEPWFVASDVCKALAIKNASAAQARLDNDEKGITSIDTLGGRQEMLAVNESGLYSLIMGSRKAEAKRFKKWVTAEVLPEIRKTGSYGIDPMRAMNDPHMLRGMLLTYSEKVIALESKVSEQAPKVEALDRIATASEGSLCIRDAAKVLQMKEKDLIAMLIARKWVYRRVPSRKIVAYDVRLRQGVMEHKYTEGERADGSKWEDAQARITAKGIAKLAEILALPISQQAA